MVSLLQYQMSGVLRTVEEKPAADGCVAMWPTNLITRVFPQSAGREHCKTSQPKAFFAFQKCAHVLVHDDVLLNRAVPRLFDVVQSLDTAHIEDSGSAYLTSAVRSV